MKATSTIIPHPYAEFLHEVLKPARYTGGEVGVVAKPWSEVDATICLAFPDVYDIGMSHLGFKILYKVLNDDPRTLAERAYCPWSDMEAELRSRELPLVSLGTYRPLCDFDVVGFSLQFELTFSNILTMLDLGGISLKQAERGEDEPLVIAGGPNATHPEPLAMFLDAVVIGDGEAKLTEVALCWMDGKKAGLNRAERLRALADLGGVYIPSLYEAKVHEAHGLQVVVAPDGTAPKGRHALPFPVERTMVNINDYPFPSDSPTGGPEAVFDRTSIEITRGCTEGCRFCQAGMIYRPVQEREPAQVIEAVRQSLKNSGNDEVSLTALSTADVSYINPLIKTLAPELAEQGVALSVSSLRAYGLEGDLLDELSRGRTGGLTFAPEAGTQRMRDVVNKNVTEEQLHETAERVFSRGYQRMKLYFMIGLPTEQDEDVAGIIDTAARTAEVGRRAAGKKRVAVTASVSTHVPKPHTPFQWAAMDSLDLIDEKHAYMRQLVRPHRQVTLRTHDAKGSVLEGVMARGDRRVGEAILHAWKNGARFDSWDECLNTEVWNEAFAACGIEIDLYLGTLPTTAPLPWSHIDVGLEDGFLLREYQRALQDRLSPPCGKVKGMFIHHTNLGEAEPDQRKLVCYDCGVACDLTQMRDERLVHLRRLPKSEPRAADAAETEPVMVKPRGRITDGKGPRIGDPNEGFGYRFEFTKVGPVALLGHLDLVRELPRIFRRLEIEQVFSGGYRPKPKMMFSPALSLGVMGLAELLDLRLQGDFDEDGLSDLCDAMNRHSPVGLNFVRARRLVQGEDAVTKRIEGARYLIGLPEAAPGVADLDLAARCAELMAATELVAERKTKGIRRRIELRQYLVNAWVPTAENAATWLSDAGVVGRARFAAFDVRLSHRGSMRPREMARLLAGSDDDLPFRGVRVGLWSDPAARAESSVFGLPAPTKATESLVDDGASVGGAPIIDGCA